MDKKVVIVLLVCLRCGLETHGQPVYLSLGTRGEENYRSFTKNNSEIQITQMTRLTCHTDLTTCCRSRDNNNMGALGEWYYPDGRIVPHESKGEHFYRVRDGPQLVRLVRRGEASTADLGSYCCRIPTTDSEEYITFCAKIVLCPTLDTLPTNGKLYTYSDTFHKENSVATLTCNDGFVTSTPEKNRTCMSNGLWSQELVCVEACNDVDTPDIGEVIYEIKRLPGYTVTYTCDNSTRTCQLNGSWVPSAPDCAFPKCQDLSHIQNGFVMHFNGTKDQRPLNTVAIYTCDSGFKLNGPSIRTCQKNKTWSEKKPTCEEMFCGKLEQPNNGMISYSSSLMNKPFNSTATYTCEDGYKLVGPSSRTCQSDKTWSRDDPSCDQIVCSDLDLLSNGTITYNGGIDNVRPLCTVATYTCMQGFNLIGSKYRTCQNSETWSGSNPVCEGVQCQELNQPNNGVITYSQRSASPDHRPFNTIATYECNFGYKLSEENSQTCLSNKTWSGQVPICEEITCPAITLDNGEISYSVERRTVSAVAVFKCNPGYTLIGGNSAYCEVNGQWNDSAPFCIVTTCSDLAFPRNGTVDYEGSQKDQRTIAVYNCDDGYTIQGNRTRYCMINGVWSGTAPSCKVTVCPELLPPTGAMISYIPEGSSGVKDVHTVAKYSCAINYTLIGDDTTRVCQSDMIWSRSEPSCELNRCSDLRSPANGRVYHNFIGSNSIQIGTVATYNCSYGYYLRGDSVRTCQNDKTWSGSEPTCSEITCKDLGQLANGSVSYNSSSNNRKPIHTVATYSCDIGFSLEGSRIRTCEVSGNWNKNSPSCIADTCPNLPIPLHGTVTYNVVGTNDKPIDTEATYRCNNGYSLMGVSVRFCQTNKIWSGTEPVCKENTCNDLKPPANGMLTYDSGSSNSHSIGTYATYSCTTGYFLSGETTRVCQDNKVWNGSDPNCNVITCPQLDVPANGNVIYSLASVSPTAWPFNTSAHYSCNIGYSIQRRVVTVCQGNGNWNELATPTCKPITCPELDEPENGMIDYSAGSTNKRPINTTARYSCKLLHSLSGADIKTCSVDGQWSPQTLQSKCERNFTTTGIEINENVFEGIASTISSIATDSIENTESQTAKVLEGISDIFVKIAVYVGGSNGTVQPVALEYMVSTLNSLGQWEPDSLSVNSSSSIVQSYESVVARAAQQRNFTFNFSQVTLETRKGNVSILRQDGARSNFSSFGHFEPSIVLPGEVFYKRFDEQATIGVFYALYESSRLFPLPEVKTPNTTKKTIVGTPVIAATVDGNISIHLSRYDDPILIEFNMDVQFTNVTLPGSEKCVSWNFSTKSWVDTGCSTIRNGSVVQCKCTHLTNFAVLIDICSRTEGCKTNQEFDKFLSTVTYVGVVLSCIGLLITVITLLAFKELRNRDNTKHNVQLCIAIFFLLLVFVSGINQTQVYGGCVSVSALIYYFSLAAMMWMGAEAVLMFQKLVIVFGKITTSYLIAVSLICWIIPAIPVAITVLYDVLNGIEPENDLIINRNITGTNQGYCFLHHPGVFFGGFLAPILAITLFNLVIFIWIAVIVLRSTKGKLKRANEKLKPKKALRIMTSLFGVMTLFGLTWLSAAFTFTIEENNILRYLFQSLFVICGTFQGVFFFLFFCVLDKKARYAWRYAICKKRPKYDSSLFSSSASTRRTSLTRKVSVPTMQNPTDSTKAPYIPELKEKFAQDGSPTLADKIPQPGDKMILEMEFEQKEITFAGYEETISLHECSSHEQSPGAMSCHEESPDQETVQHQEENQKHSEKIH